MLAHAGGQLHAQFMARIRGRDPERCLVVPVDVGKSSAMPLVAVPKIAEIPYCRSPKVPTLRPPGWTGADIR